MLEYFTGWGHQWKEHWRKQYDSLYTSLLWPFTLVASVCAVLFYFFLLKKADRYPACCVPPVSWLMRRLQLSSSNPDPAYHFPCILIGAASAATVHQPQEKPALCTCLIGAVRPAPANHAITSCYNSATTYSSGGCRRDRHCPLVLIEHSVDCSRTSSGSFVL